MSPSEILSNKWMNWCRKCSVPIHEKMTCFSSWISPFSHKLQTRALLSGLLPYKPIYTSTHVLESWTELRSSWYFCSEPSSNTPTRQMVHVHQKPVSQANQTNCDKPQTFLRAMFLTMCLSPKCLMPEYNVYVQIRIFSFLHWNKSLLYTVPFCKSPKASSHLSSPTYRSTRILKGNICFHHIA